MTKELFKIKAKVWIYSHNHGSWHFVSIPKRMSEDISERFESAKRGFGSIKVRVTIKDISWQTSIFPDSKKSGTYFLPLKAEVREKAKITEGNTIAFTLEI